MEMIICIGCLIGAFLVILDCMFRANGLIMMGIPVVFLVLMLLFSE